MPRKRAQMYGIPAIGNSCAITDKYAQVEKSFVILTWLPTYKTAIARGRDSWLEYLRNGRAFPGTLIKLKALDNGLQYGRLD